MNGCSGYNAIARVYDKLNAEIDYSEWADFIEKCFDKFLDKRPDLLLDLACGTGRMTRELAARGYDMIGIDGSEDMLAVAMSKNPEEEDQRILYLKQDMREFELYGTVGAIVSCLDSINYILDEKDLSRVFSLAHNYLDPDGLFIFDVNTPYKFENIYSDNAYILEDEICEEYGDETERYEVYCGWQNFYDKKTSLCEFYLTLFEELDGKYLRSDEHQTERCYSEDILRAALENNGFEIIGFFGGYDFSEPKSDTQRWYIVAKAKK